MLILILSYLGGVLTIFSPCVLPVIPFVFSRSDLPFRKSGLPMLLGMALSFAIFAALSVAGGSLIIRANQYGRMIALLIFAVLGLTFLFPKLAETAMLPFVRLGGALQKKAEAKTGLGSSLLLGASIGLLWAPCAGPILGLILAGAAVGSDAQRTLGLLVFFATGAASSLGVAIFAGGKILKFLKKGLGAEEWIKRGIGITVLAAVFAIALGWDTQVLSKISYLSTNQLEKHLVDRLGGSDQSLDGQDMPSLQGANAWLNSNAITDASLKGKIVLVDFWTYSCVNCLRTLPYLKAWYEKYKDQGLVVIGIHTPEFAFEKDVGNVKKAIHDLGISYPVAIDNDQLIWHAFKNQYWPAHYFIDTRGKIRFHHFGEGNEEESEKIIQALLMEKNSGGVQPLVQVQGQGVEAPATQMPGRSPETYLGYSLERGFASSPTIKVDQIQEYQHPKTLSLNQWGAGGIWKIGSERITSMGPKASVRYQFKARDLNLVLGHLSGQAIRFKITIDGKAPGDDHGVDVDEAGFGEVSDHRLYQLIRKKSGNDVEQTFQIEFDQPGALAYAFTFG